MASENLSKYLEAARRRRVHEQDARKQEMAARHEARRRDFDARSEPLNVHVVRDHLTVLNDFDDVDRTRGPWRTNTCDLELDPGVFELLTSIIAVEFVLQFRACFGEVRSRSLKHSDDMDIERL